MQKHKFPLLFKDELQYEQSQLFWKNTIAILLNNKNISYQPYYNHFFSNGKQMFDANPIFDVYVNNMNKLIFIKIEEPSNDEYMTAWVEVCQKEEQYIHQLVVALEMTSANIETTKKLIKQWLINNLTPQQMEQYIEKNIPQHTVLS